MRKETSKMPHSTSDRYLYGSSTQCQCYSDCEVQSCCYSGYVETLIFFDYRICASLTVERHY